MWKVCAATEEARSNAPGSSRWMRWRLCCGGRCALDCFHGVVPQELSDRRVQGYPSRWPPLLGPTSSCGAPWTSDASPGSPPAERLSERAPDQRAGSLLNTSGHARCGKQPTDRFLHLCSSRVTEGILGSIEWKRLSACGGHTQRYRRRTRSRSHLTRDLQVRVGRKGRANARGL